MFIENIKKPAIGLVFDLKATGITAEATRTPVKR